MNESGTSHTDQGVSEALKKKYR